MISSKPCIDNRVEFGKFLLQRTWQPYQGHERGNSKSSPNNMAEQNALSQDRRNQSDFNHFLRDLKSIPIARRENEISEWGSRAEVVHIEVVLQLVADLLGLEYENVSAMRIEVDGLRKFILY